MKFPRFYNPFARIRDLEASLEEAQAYNEKLADGLATTVFGSIVAIAQAQAEAEEIGNNWHRLYVDVCEDLEVAEQAIDAFMDDRETLKYNIALRDELGVELMAAGASVEEELQTTRGALERAVGDVQGLAVEVEDLKQDSIGQATHTLEVVRYVKDAEAALSAVGVTLTDAAAGPHVNIDLDAILAAVRTGAVTTVTTTEAA